MSASSSIPVEAVNAAEERTSERSKQVSKKQRRGSVSGAKRDPSRSESFGGAVIRALFGSLAFLFKRPVRLFRPVKLSSWTILDAMAKREGRTLSLRYLRSLLRRENKNFLPHLLMPPLLFNTAIGFTLFEAYSITEARLIAKSKAKRGLTEEEQEAEEEEEGNEEGKRKKPKWTPLWIVTASGAVAGAAQCFLSAPLDNVRYIIQRNVSGPQHSSAAGRPITTISWRAILRAAVLPFAPAIARDRLVQDVQNETIERSKRAPKPTLRARLIALVEPATSSLRSTQSVSERLTMSPEKRKEWETRLKRWRGGVHGSGLMLSLIRDSVGFGSFFFIFECSRRGAYYASTGVDKVSAWVNARGLGIVRTGSNEEERGSNVVERRRSDDGANEAEVHIESSADSRGRWIREGRNNVEDADMSYNTSRTVQGRVVAVIILLIGGAVGAFSYELVGRPFELMRVVIWEGRKQWEQGKREPGYRADPKSTWNTHSQVRAEDSGFTTTGRSAVRGARAAAAARAEEELGAKVSLRRPDFLVLRAQNSAGSRTSRVWKRANISRPPHPLRLIGTPKWAGHKEVRGTAAPMLTSSRALKVRKATRTTTPSSLAPQAAAAAEEAASAAAAESNAKPRLGRRPSPTLATRPGFLTLLIEHAQATAKLDRPYSGPSDPAKTSIPLLLLHTYFIAPFLPEIPKPVLDNEIVRTVAGVDKHLHPSGSASSSSPHRGAGAGDRLSDKITTAAQRTLLLSLASRRRSANSPEAKMRRNWIRNNPVNFSLASRGDGNGKVGGLAETRTGRKTGEIGKRVGGFGASDAKTLKKGTRFWASGRVVWTLKRLATPYGVAFLVFAWLGGDLN